MKNSESPNVGLFEEVKALFLNEKMTRYAIYQHLRGRAARATVDAYCRRVIREAEMAGQPLAPRRDPLGTAAFTGRVLGKEHHWVGTRLLQHRFLSEGSMSQREYAQKHGIGNQLSLARMEHGQYDFTLSELSHIAEVLGLTLEELFAPANTTKRTKEKDNPLGN